MTTIYQVRDWDTHFEKAYSRRVPQCRYAVLPNKQDGLYYQRTVGKEETLPLYGVFVAIILMLTKQPVPRKGWMTDNGKRDGVPLTTFDIHMKTGCPEKYVARALEYFSAEASMGTEPWIIAHGDKSPKKATPCPNAPEEKTTPKTVRQVDRIKYSEDKGLHGYTDKDIENWATAYPALNVNQQLRQLGEWLKTNPTKRPRKNVASFISRNLSRKQDEGGKRLATYEKMQSQIRQKKDRYRRIEDELRGHAKHLLLVKEVGDDSGAFWEKVRDEYPKSFKTVKETILALANKIKKESHNE